MTDYWPSEEGAIFDYNSYIVPCYPDAAIVEMGAVKVGTTVAGRISVTVCGADTGTGIGIALRAATGAGVPPRIPVLFYGIAKVTSCATANYYLMAGSYAFNNGPTNLYQATAGALYTQFAAGGGASYIMGLCLQGVSGGTGDEVLLLVGKTC